MAARQAQQLPKPTGSAHKLAQTVGVVVCERAWHDARVLCEVLLFSVHYYHFFLVEQL